MTDLLFGERDEAYGYAARTASALQLVGHPPIELECSGYYTVEEARQLRDWLTVAITEEAKR